MTSLSNRNRVFNLVNMFYKMCFYVQQDTSNISHPENKDGPLPISTTDNRSKFVSMKGCMSERLVAQEHHSGLYSYRISSLCTRQTSSTTESCHLHKYPEDSAVVGCISDRQNAEHRELVAHWEQSVDLEGKKIGRVADWRGNATLKLPPKKGKGQNLLLEEAYLMFATGCCISFSVMQFSQGALASFHLPETCLLG